MTSPRRPTVPTADSFDCQALVTAIQALPIQLTPEQA
jgi:hypothetical protein